MTKGRRDRAVSLFLTSRDPLRAGLTEDPPAPGSDLSLYERRNHDVATAACFLVTCRFSGASCKWHCLKIKKTKRDSGWNCGCLADQAFWKRIAAPMMLAAHRTRHWGVVSGKKEKQALAVWIYRVTVRTVETSGGTRCSGAFINPVTRPARNKRWMNSMDRRVHRSPATVSIYNPNLKTPHLKRRFRPLLKAAPMVRSQS